MGKHSAPRRPRTPLAASRGTALLGGSAALAVAFTGLTPLASGAVSDAIATPIDGCGRVDSVSVTGSGSSYTLEFPTVLVPSDPANPRSPKIMATEQMAPNGNTWTWTRRSNYIDSLAVKGLTFRVIDDQCSTCASTARAPAAPTPSS